MNGLLRALLCALAGTAAGWYARERSLRRFALLLDWLDALAAVRLLLVEERLAIPALLRQAAEAVARPQSPVSIALEAAGERLSAAPGLTVMQAFGDSLPTAGREETAALWGMLRLLGTGSAAMREQAVAACVRQLKPLSERAREKLQSDGKLFLRLGALGGVALGIAIW